MEIQITPQLIQDIKRQIEFNYDRFIKETIKLQTQEFKLFKYTAHIDNWKIKWFIVPVLHEMNCSKYNYSCEIDNTIIGKCTECINEEGYKVNIVIYYNKTLIKILSQNTMLDGNLLTWNNLEHKLSFLEKPIKICNSGKKAKNDKSRECNLFSYTRTEDEGDCVVCL